MSSVLDPFRFVLIAIAGWMNQRQLHAIDYLREENRILRKQLGTRGLRLTDDQRRRLAVRARVVGRKLLADIATVVKPETLLAWHRRLIANKYERPRVVGWVARVPPKRSRHWSPNGIRESRMGLPSHPGCVVESPSPTRPQHHCSDSEAARSRTRAGSGTKTTWKEFLVRHWQLLVAADFFTVEVWMPRGLQRFVVLFFIDLSSRKVEIAGSMRCHLPGISRRLTTEFLTARSI